MPEQILAYKITRSGIEELHLDLPDFDSITASLPKGLYSTFRTYAERTKVLGLSLHLDRLYIPAKALEIGPAIRRPEELREALARLLNRFPAPEARVRLVLDTSVEQGTMYILLQPMQALPNEVYEHGVRLEISKTSRKKPALKQTGFISESAFDRKRVGGGTFEVLLTNKGRILEGMTSNFFYVRDRVLGTAGRGVLIGVTRQTVLAFAKWEGIKTSIKALPINEIFSIQEAFITSSSRGIVPVVQIDAQQVADGKVGRVSRRLMSMYDENIYAIAEEIF
jgi:branched-chain amino acid aminotransferase